MDEIVFSGVNEVSLDVDAVYCINLPERTDKLHLAKDTLTGIRPEVVFHHPERDVENPVRGCFNSHRDLAVEGLKKGYKNILIFEDDVQLYQPFTSNHAKKINRFLRTTAFDILYLGYASGKTWLSLTRPGFVHCATEYGHAYILSEAGMKQLAMTEYTHLAIDTYYEQNFLGYALLPMCFRQRAFNAGESDIQQGQSKDDDFWKKNYKKQFKRLWRAENIIRTLTFKKKRYR